MDIDVKISDRFSSYIMDWDYEKYLVIGGYGSGKSQATAQKIVLKLLQEKRTCLVVRNVFTTIKDSCFEILKQIVSDMDLLSFKDKDKNKIVFVKSPMEVRFPNGSRIIFRGMDNTEKIKSIHGVSIVWMEECSELNYKDYTEILGRVRQPNMTLHFILTCNPVGRENWVYDLFFTHTEKKEDKIIKKTVQDEEELYRRKTLVNKKNGVYYHHSTVDDNPFLPQSYIDNLEELKYIDESLYQVARFGKFGANGIKVLPNFTVATNAKEFKAVVHRIPSKFHFFGFDFGFETSFNALISCCVDDAEKVLYIYDEVYMNNITDDKFSKRDDVQKVKERSIALDKPIICDSAEPKTIKYYRQEGFYVKKCKKYIGSRLQNTKKIKRFKKIVCSPRCVNTIIELKDLVYAKDTKDEPIYDQFNIDPHTFKSATLLGVYKRMEESGKAEMLIRTEVIWCMAV